MGQIETWENAIDKRWIYHGRSRSALLCELRSSGIRCRLGTLFLDKNNIQFKSRVNFFFWTSAFHI